MRAALSVLGVTVTVNQQKSDAPRSVAETTLPDGFGSRAEADDSRESYMSPSSR